MSRTDIAFQDLEMKVQFTNIYGNALLKTNYTTASQQQLSYSMSFYPIGIYFVSVMSKDGITNKKIIKD